METTELRPSSLGELLDRTFRLYRNHFWLFAGIMAIPSAFSIPFTVIFLSTRNDAPFGARSAGFPSGAVFFLVAFWFFFAAVYSIAIGATTYAVSDCYLNQKANVRESYRKVRGKVWKIIGVVLVAWLRAVGMLVLGGAAIAIAPWIIIGALAATSRGRMPPILAVIFGILAVLIYLVGLMFWALWSLRYAVCIPALLLENLGVRAALRRSVQLTRGRRWQILIAVFLCTIIAYIGVILFQGPFLISMMVSTRGGQVAGWLTYVYAMGGAIGGAITGPVLLIMLVLCYYDTRIRKEAFDLQYMMSALDSPAPAPDAPSPA